MPAAGTCRLDSPSPGVPNPIGLAPIGGLVTSPLGSPRQECEGTQAQSRSVRICFPCLFGSTRLMYYQPARIAQSRWEPCIGLAVTMSGARWLFLRKCRSPTRTKTATLEFVRKATQQALVCSSTIVMHLEGERGRRSAGRIGAVHILLINMRVWNQDIRQCAASRRQNQRCLHADLFAVNSVQPRRRCAMALCRSHELVQDPASLPVGINCPKLQIRDPARKRSRRLGGHRPSGRCQHQCEQQSSEDKTACLHDREP